MEKIGPYKLIRSIAKGGMGEVFLAYDPYCKREIALKCIRSEYLSNKIIYKRFVKEALIASKLAHPNIIPIHSLSDDKNLPYYTMPYIEGKTLKQLLLEAREQQKNYATPSASDSSIPYLAQIFATICEAVAYAHDKKIIHRDLKPENILIGKHGSILIFDWGVADKIENITEDEPIMDFEELELSDLTSPGKIIGTFSFLAPERFEKKLSNYLTDIYSLGVMLYMILTLQLPFRRKNLKEIRKSINKEKFRNPIDVAPYRDIPRTLALISKKCLQPNPKDRYQNMAELIKDLRNFTEGQSEWVFIDEIDPNNKKSWEFNENILVSNHQAISYMQNALEWVSLMISKKNFELNSQIETTFTLMDGCKGLGFLINSPKSTKRKHIIDGYHLWLSAETDKPSLLFRNNVEVLSLPHILLKSNCDYNIRLEKVNNHVILYIDGQRQFTHLSYLPLMNTHIGLISRDTLYKVSSIQVSVASPSLIISCLEVPDAFMHQKHFDKAIVEYRRIGKVFTGRHESREAYFRAGLAVLEQAINAKSKQETQSYYNKALKEFEELRHTPGAPLEYLGKALVYQNQKETSEELKCLELSLRRYPNHPLLYLIYDHIIFRLYQSSHTKRMDTHKFIFLALRYNAYAKQKQMIDPLVLNLTDRRRMLFFLEPSPTDDLQSLYLEMIINLGFLLNKAYVFEEILESYTLDKHFIRNILINFHLLGEKQAFKKYLPLIDETDRRLVQIITKKVTQKSFDYLLQERPKVVTPFEECIFFVLIDKVLIAKKFNLAQYIFKTCKNKHLVFSKKEDFLYYNILTHLLCKNAPDAKSLYNESKQAFQKAPHRTLFLKGCLYASENKVDQAITSFSDELESSLPDVDMLAALYISKQLKINKWQLDAFDFEKEQLYKQLYFFYIIANNAAKAQTYYKKWITQAKI